MAKDDNQKTMQKFMGSMGEESPDLGAIFTDDFVDHDPAPGQPEGGAGLFWFWKGFTEAFPDVSIQPETEVADDDYIVSVITITGTQSGDFLGHPSTGQPISVRGVQVAKFVDGRMSERWGSTDQLGILQQTGALPDSGDDQG